MTQKSGRTPSTSASTESAPAGAGLGEQGDAALVRPLRKDAERNRQRILTAAREVFAVRGLEVSMDDIARHAELGIGTVYRRFPSREHLVEALFEERLNWLVTVAEEASVNPNPWAGLTDFMERAVQAMGEDLGLRDVLFGRAYGHSHVNVARTRLEPAVTQLVARVRDAGLLRPGIEAYDVPLIQFMIGAMIEYTEQIEPGLWRRYLALMLDGLRAAPDREAPARAAPSADAARQIAQRWKPMRRSGLGD